MNKMTRALLAGCAAALALAGCSPQTGDETADVPNADAPRNDALCDGPAVLQVLGSGGPIADDDRAGASYLIRRNGVPVALIDAGSGTFLRFAQARASITPLKVIALSHFHADHVADLAAILNSGNFEKREAPLPIVGPAAGGIYPGLTDHLNSLFARDSGAFPYLSGYLTGEGDAPKLEITEVDTTDSALVTVFAQDDLAIEAMSVHHLDVPALAYRVTLGDAVVLLPGDQSFLSEDFEQVMAGSAPDLMVIHNAIPEGPGQPRGLHRSPSSWAELVARVQPKQLVVSHNMLRALEAEEDTIFDALAGDYRGNVTLASDLACFAIKAAPQ
ncbi:MAG: MBL fold metallo-hydrolase [Pseudomonadota bacterium]